MDYANIQNIFAFYSTFSKASSQLLEMMDKAPLGFIRRICVDNPVLRRHALTKITKVPSLLIVYADGSTQLIEGIPSFAFIQQLIRDTAPPPTSSAPNVTPLPEFDTAPLPQTETTTSTESDVEFNMLTSNPNKYMTDDATTTTKSLEPKSLTQNHPPKNDDLEFKMLEPVRHRQETNDMPPPPPPPRSAQPSDDSKLDIQKILDSAKNQSAN